MSEVPAVALEVLPSGTMAYAQWRDARSIGSRDAERDGDGTRFDASTLLPRSEAVEPGRLETRRAGAIASAAREVPRRSGSSDTSRPCERSVVAQAGHGSRCASRRRGCSKRREPAGVPPAVGRLRQTARTEPCASEAATGPRCPDHLCGCIPGAARDDSRVR